MKINNQKIKTRNDNIHERKNTELLYKDKYWNRLQITLN
jgi:hypothetical protein